MIQYTVGTLEHTKLGEVEQLGIDYSEMSVKYCRECLSLLARIDAHFCSVQATYHYLMHGYHVLNDLEMRTHFQDVSKELLGLAARLQGKATRFRKGENGGGRQ